MESAKKEIVIKLLEQLKGLRWCFISGIAVFFYTNGKRKFNDIDILINEKDINKFAERLGCKPEKRKVKKGQAILKDYGFEISFLGQPIETVTSYPNDKIQKNKVQKTLKNKVKKIYLGEEVYLTPIEDLITHKSFMHRDKDLLDLELLKNNPINSRLVKEFANDWGNKEKIINLLKKIGYKI